MTILVACGLKREARICTRDGFVAVAGGGDGARLERDLRDAVAAGGVTAILSSGLAGAIDPALRAGDLLIGRSVRSGKRDAALAARLSAILSDARQGVVVGSDVAVASIVAKRRLAAETGAIAVDMESHVAARVAADHHLPFAVVRAVSDDAGHALPRAALVGMRPDGGMAIRAVLGALLRDPMQIAALIRTARDAERAFRALACAYDALGRAGIGLADLGEFGLDMA